jgi:hypothetical protein
VNLVRCSQDCIRLMWSNGEETDFSITILIIRVLTRWSYGFIAPRPLYTGPLCPTCWNSFLPSSPEALRTHRRERPLLAREGNWREFSQQPAIRNRSWDFWHAPKLGHGTDYFTSPPMEGMLRIFFTSEKIQRPRSGSNPRTRETEASMLTTRPPKPSGLLTNSD